MSMAPEGCAFEIKMGLRKKSLSITLTPAKGTTVDKEMQAKHSPDSERDAFDKHGWTSDSTFLLYPVFPWLSNCCHWTRSRPTAEPNSEVHSHFSHGYGSIDLVSRESGMLFILKFHRHLLIFSRRPKAIRDGR